MLRRLLRVAGCGVSVYEGISPSLLATMSLSVNIGGSTHEELIDSMVKQKLISGAEEQKAFRQVDRQWFTTAQSPYQNKPYPISDSQSMTDIFTHSLIVSTLTPYFAPNMRILEVGTGHGYLSFLLSKILTLKKLSPYEMTAIDISQAAIDECQRIQTQYFASTKSSLYFKCQDLHSHLQENPGRTYDAVIGGYFFDEQTSNIVESRLSQRGVGVWPTKSEQGQALYKVQRGKEKSYIVQTMFSMPVVRQEVSKYFLSQNEAEQQSSTQKQESHDQKQSAQTVQQVKRMRQQMVQKIKSQLKVLLDQYKSKNGRAISLAEMKQIPQINDKLIELEKVKKKPLKANKPQQ